MPEAQRSFEVDLRRALEEFGYGPSDSENETDAEEEIADEWDSIGLLPSWEKLQITLRNASYSFIAGMRREASEKTGGEEGVRPTTPTSQANDGGKALSNMEADKLHSKAGDGRGEENPVPEAKSNEIGVTPTSRMEPTIEPQNSQKRTQTAKRRSKNESLEHGGDDEGDIQSVDEEGNGEDGDDDEEGERADENDEVEDEMEEIGRFPSFNQLQITLKSASEMFNMPPHFFGQADSYLLPSIRSPADLLTKWGGTANGEKAGWQAFMQNFQLPSFLAEELSEEEEPLDPDDPETARILALSDLTPEDHRIGYTEEGLTGCSHYLRNCKSECSVCKRFYMCQLCHDEHDPTHQMDRTKTRRMLCLTCHRTQPPARKCRFCKEVMGDYYCSVCKLWNDDPDKPIYHCGKCGICRVGRGLGIDVFHCDTCDICLSLSVQNNHKCIEQAAKSNCPICLDDLFSSSKPVVFMPCGHPIHRECFTEYSKRYYRCPVCSKSILNTSALFRMIDEEVQCEVLPPELANKMVNIVCQDCRLKSQTHYHLAGLKCETCGSYNTAQL